MGAAFGVLARKEGNLFPRRNFTCALVALVLVGIGVPASAYVLYPAWMWGYYVDSRQVTSLPVVLIFALYAALFLGGYVLPRRLERARRGTGWAAAFIALLTQAALLAWQWPRYFTVTTLEGFREGRQVAPNQIPFLAWTFPCSVAVLALLLWLARPGGRSGPSPPSGRSSVP
ncbi:MAG: hypothetical protein HY716_07095 [Planctomycetes bacterium]|nr:hypothetical protein [Planctomycetota bacterium]